MPPIKGHSPPTRHGKMGDYHGALLTDLEAALKGGLADKRVETLRRVADLFVNDSERLQPEHVAVFDDVMWRLSQGIESRARAELSKRIAAIVNAPIGMIKDLAADDAIEVAAPVLA